MFYSRNPEYFPSSVAHIQSFAELLRIFRPLSLSLSLKVLVSNFLANTVNFDPSLMQHSTSEIQVIC